MKSICLCLATLALVSPALAQTSAKRLPSQPGLKQGNPLDHRFYFSNAIFGDFDNDGWLSVASTQQRPGHG